MLTRLHDTLTRLALTEPQCLLLEGGSESARLDLATFWAMTANCPAALSGRKDGSIAAPCRECQTCRQIEANEYADLLIYDGRISNRADEEKPGPIRALRIENIRELKSLTGTAPHGGGKRIAIFQGLTQTREEAMNSLLKTLEEPTPHTMFVLLAPQRQQILPTLVSRSFCLTLPWPDSSGHDEKWDNAIAGFLNGNPALLDQISAKGALDAENASAALLACQRSLVRSLSGRGSGPLDAALAPLARAAKKAALASRWLSEAQEMLAATVSPPRALEAFLSRFYLLLRQQ